MQVRVLSPPPFLFNDLPLRTNHAPSVPVATWRDFGAIPMAGLGRNGKRMLVQRIDCCAEILRHRMSVPRSHLQSGVTQQCHDVHLVPPLPPYPRPDPLTQIFKPNTD